jgi:hypothetical protein
MSSETLPARAAALQRDYEERAGRYDGLVVKNRTTATIVETIVAICLVLVGSSSIAGGFSSINAAIDSADDAGVSAWDVVYAFLVPLVSLVAAVLGAYLKVCNPRGKQQLFGSASDACGAVSSVAKIVAATRLGSDGDQTLALSNMVSSMLTTLETAATDNQPPLAPAPTKKGR